MLNIFTIKINFIFRNLKFELAATIDNNGVDEEIIKNSKLCKVTRQNDCKLRKTRGRNQDSVFYTFVQVRPNAHLSIDGCQFVAQTLSW